MNKILRLPEVKLITGLSRSTIYLMMKKGVFPKNIILGARAVGWVESDLSLWIESKVTREDRNYSNSQVGD